MSVTLTGAVDGGGWNPCGVSFGGIVSAHLPVPISPFSEDTRT